MIQRLTYTGWQDTIVSGWGADHFDYDDYFDNFRNHEHNVSGNLKWVQVVPVSDDTCSDAFSYPFPDHVICAGELWGGPFLVTPPHILLPDMPSMLNY